MRSAACPPASSPDFTRRWSRSRPGPNLPGIQPKVPEKERGSRPGARRQAVPTRFGARTNLALLAVLGAAFLTGWLAFAYATAPARWSLVLHATTGFAILVLVPWKSIMIRRGVRRRRPGRSASVALGVLVLASLLGGVLHATGLLRWWGAYTAMELHVGAALLAVPLAVWHVLARPVRPRRIDLARRTLLRQGATPAVHGAAHGASEE